MIVVTGGAGFIGSALVWKLNQEGIEDILVVDNFADGQKWQNLKKRQVTQLMHRDEFLGWLGNDGKTAKVEAIFHMGARSKTTEEDCNFLIENNINYSAEIWKFCVAQGIPFVYASSASVYGAGENGFSDDHEQIAAFTPANGYGFSKHQFDSWALKQTKAPPFWMGLRFFNVYGPQEYHKGDQSSVIPQFVQQVQKAKKIRLFKSYHQDFADGEQRRDFVYVKDCTDFMWHGFKSRPESGIYNVGTGNARTFRDIASAIFSAMNIDQVAIEYIEMPAALRAHYQYFTEADCTKIRERGRFLQKMADIEVGISDYVRNYLLTKDHYL